MYDRMLNKLEKPTMKQMQKHCGECGEMFENLNVWLLDNYECTQEIVFPYGKQYGWGVTHKLNKKLVCNVFAEVNAFTVMLRLKSKQFDCIYNEVSAYTKDYIDNKYPCSDGGWIHYRVSNASHLDDIYKLLSSKCE